MYPTSFATLQVPGYGFGYMGAPAAPPATTTQAQQDQVCAVLRTAGATYAKDGFAAARKYVEEQMAAGKLVVGQDVLADPAKAEAIAKCTFEGYCEEKSGKAVWYGRLLGGGIGLVVGGIAGYFIGKR